MGTQWHTILAVKAILSRAGQGGTGLAQYPRQEGPLHRIQRGVVKGSFLSLAKIKGPILAFNARKDPFMT